MPIKINGKDLSKRIINWKEVQKVILNWAEIRPSSVPHIDYHVIWDFTWGWGGWGWGGWGLPNWWEWVSGNYAISDDGIYSTDGSTVRFNYNTMPSLANATKIEIAFHFTWTWETPIGTGPTISWDLSGSGANFADFWIDFEQDSFWLNSQISYGAVGRPFTYVSKSWYMLKSVMFLDNWWGEGYTWKTSFTDKDDISIDINFSRNLNQSDIVDIKGFNLFDVHLWRWVVVSKIDFYIYNNLPPQENQWGSYIFDWENFIPNP